jgi:hypothetical protein
MERIGFTDTLVTNYQCTGCADKSLARPTSRYSLFDCYNISFDSSLVIYIYIFVGAFQFWVKLDKNNLHFTGRLAAITLHFSFLFLLAQQHTPPPPVGQGFLIHEVSRSHTTTHYSRQDSSVRVISSTQIPLSGNKQHS